jgi:hypothetical protein
MVPDREHFQLCLLLGKSNAAGAIRSIAATTLVLLPHLLLVGLGRSLGFPIELASFDVLRQGVYAVERQP